MSIFNIQPNKVSKSLRGYTVMLYGDPKSGKTSNAVKFPKHLLMAFEKGYSAIPGAMANPVNSWSQFRKDVRDLGKAEAKENFETIIIDTADIAYDLCEKHICQINDVDSIADIPFGKGYGEVAKEFDEQLRSITQMGYGLVLISHAVDKTFTDESGAEFNQIISTLPKKANTIVSRMCDIIGYARTVQLDEGELQTRLFMRGTPRFVAGSRFSDVKEVGYVFPHSIEFTYDELVKTIAEAVEAVEKANGASAVTSEMSQHNAYEIDIPELEEILEMFNEEASALMSENETYYGPRIQQIVESHFGRGKKISEAKLGQTELAYSVLQGVKELKEQD